MVKVFFKLYFIYKDDLGNHYFPIENVEYLGCKNLK